MRGGGSYPHGPPRLLWAKGTPWVMVIGSDRCRQPSTDGASAVSEWTSVRHQLILC